MIQLKHLKHEKCPTCGEPQTGISVTSLHTNGEQFEEVRFKCDCTIRWVPNFSREEAVRPCPKAPKPVVKPEPYVLDLLHDSLDRRSPGGNYKGCGFYNPDQLSTFYVDILSGTETIRVFIHATTKPPRGA